MLGIFTVSIYSLLAVSIDRYIAVCHSSFYHANAGVKTTLTAIAISWILGVFGFFPLLGWNSGAESFESCDTRMIYDFNFVIFLCVVVSFIPTALIVIIYFLIYKQILDQVRIFYITYTRRIIKTFKSKIFRPSFAEHCRRETAQT